MKKLLRLSKMLLVAVGLLAGVNEAWAEEANLTPTADTYFDFTNKTTSFGSATTLYCGVWLEMWTNATPGLKPNGSDKIAVFKFDVSAYKGKITSATFKVTATNPSTNTNTRSVYLGYFDKTDWTEASTASDCGMNTRHATALNIHPFSLSQSIAKGTTKEVSFESGDFLTYLNSDEDGIVSLTIYGLGQECTVNSKEAASGKPTLVLTYTNETLYTATFTETNGLTPAVTIYSDSEMSTPVTNGTLTTGNTYYYKAVLTGYNDATGSFTVSNAAPAVSFTMTAKTAVTSLTVNYKKGEEVVFTDNQSVAGLYVGDSKTVPYRMYVTNDGKLYKADAQGSNPYYGISTPLVAETVVNIAVTEQDLKGGTIAFFKDLDADVSESADIRASYGSSYNNRAYTSDETLAPGIYSFILKAENKGRGSSIKVGDITVCGISDINSSNNVWTDKTITGIEIPVADNVTLVKGGSNTIDCYDIIIAIKTADYTVSAEIGEKGWATLYTDKALDFSAVEGLTAYTAELKGSTVTLTKVGNVPANTGVVLKGAGNTYSIPVIASSTTAQGNLQGSATATAFNAFTGYDLYMLAKNGSEAQFKKVSSGSIPAGKAFLKVATGGAPALGIVFGDATGIEAVKKAETVADGAYYNLAGQRVAQPTKGLYIVNGKKVVIK